jgi:hypothetical protein
MEEIKKRVKPTVNTGSRRNSTATKELVYGKQKKYLFLVD